MSSQEVINFVRYQVSQGKELTEIGEMICEYCLAPDTTSGAGIGCDNMTVLIVAITHGRSKEDWYAWITDRVQNNYGYETPSTLPQLYAQSRLTAFRAKREMHAKQLRAREEKLGARNALPSPRPSISLIQAHSPYDSPLLSGSEGDDELPEVKMRVMKWGPNGPISYQPGGDIVNHSGELMFVNDDNDDDDDDFEEDNGGRSFFSETLGLGRAESPDPTRNLKAQLSEYEKEIREQDGNSLVHADGNSDKEPTQGENYSSPLDIPFLITFFLKYLTLVFQNTNGRQSYPMVMRRALQNQRRLPYRPMGKLLNLSRHDCYRYLFSDP